ncbi:MAG: hypothetical protein AAB472_01860 [Patescibacteria group bacterium]
MVKDIHSALRPYPSILNLLQLIELVMQEMKGCIPVAETPFFIDKEGMLVPDTVKQIAFGYPGSPERPSDLLTELLLISHKITAGEYEAIHLKYLSQWSDSIAVFVREHLLQFCETEAELPPWGNALFDFTDYRTIH